MPGGFAQGGGWSGLELTDILAESWDMQNDMEKCKNDNLFSVQVLVLLR